MYFEEVALITSDHLRTHIDAYLTEVNARAAKQIQLSVPKSISPTSVVGGMVTAYDEILPQYGIDVLSKNFSPSGEDLYTYEYLGQINGMVHGHSEESVDALVKRHASAVELFIRRHQFMHESQTTPLNPNFKLLDFLFGTVDFSGAEDAGVVNDRTIWYAAFSINVSWLISEDGPGQH